MTGRAVLLTGSIGLGHDMPALSCANLLESYGWRTRTLNSLSLLGSGPAQAGEQVFGRLVTIPAVYDALHFAHLRAGSPVASALDRWSARRVVPALRAELEREPADLVLSIFATGAAAAARLKAELPARRTIVLCPDVAAHRLWVTEGTDLFLVTSAAAAASVRRFLPRARVAVIPMPVRAAFYSAPSQQQARTAFGVPADAPCVLFIDSGWGFGRVAESVARLARAGVHVLAVAGRNQGLESEYRSLADGFQQVHPFGFSEQVPQLMAAADIVIALPGASTCAEARVVGRPLLLLDVIPGHGRDNLLHELELGRAEVCGPTPADVAAAALALLNRAPQPAAKTTDSAPRWEPAFEAACEQIGLEFGPRQLAEAGTR
ncbi:MAG TPA: glycosyltransferase [Streptosporangiaceae bacterium]|nr:glycosyltransferase [Streptosporangiaceae bacterium]